MAYYVGSITQSYQQKGLVKSVPTYFEDAFTISNSGSGIVIELREYVLGNYFLPQGALLARLLVNGRLLADDLPVTDYSLPQISANQHRWEVRYDIGSADLVKLSDTTPVLIDTVQLGFYVNEEGLRSVEIAERDRTNAFDYFKQDVIYEASATGFHDFWFYPYVRQDFASDQPLTVDVISRINELDHSSFPSRGLRFVFTPLFNPSAFIVNRLYSVRVYRLGFDADAGPQQADALKNLVGEITVTGEQLTVKYRVDASKSDESFGPFVSTGPSVQPGEGFLGTTPSTVFKDHRLSVDPVGTDGLVFLEPAFVSTDWSASLAADEMVMRFALSSHFSVTRDLTAELLVQVKSDLKSLPLPLVP